MQMSGRNFLAPNFKTTVFVSAMRIVCEVLPHHSNSGELSQGDRFLFLPRKKKQNDKIITAKWQDLWQDFFLFTNTSSSSAISILSALQRSLSSNTHLLWSQNLTHKILGIVLKLTLLIVPYHSIIYFIKTNDNVQIWVFSVTCVVSSLHGAVMVAHCVEVVEVVLWVTAHPIGSSPRRPVGGETPAALAPLHHMGRHVHARQWELHHVLQLHPAISILQHTSFVFMHCLLEGLQAEVHFKLHGTVVHQYLSEALQVKDEDVWQGPQAEFNAALLELLAVRTSPRVIRSQLEQEFTES